MAETEARLEPLCERFDPEPWIEAERDAWLIIDPFAMTGRRLVGARPDWAFPESAYL